MSSNIKNNSKSNSKIVSDSLKIISQNKAIRIKIENLEYNLDTMINELDNIKKTLEIIIKKIDRN